MIFTDKNIKINKFLQNINLFLLALITLCLFSCSNDPITIEDPPGNPAIDTTELYQWSIDTIVGNNFYSMYVADTDNVFIAAKPPLHFDGEKFNVIELNDPTFSVGGAIHGYDKNNVFIGGGRINNPYGPAEFKKVEGPNVTGYVIPGDSGVNIGSFLVQSPNQSWIGTSEWRWVYYFDNGTYTKYELDNGVMVGVIYKSPTNSLYVLGYSASSSNQYYTYMYKLINNTFFRIINDTITNDSEMRINTVRCGQDLIREGKTSLFYFDHDFERWSLLCNTASFNPNGWGGISKERLTALGYGNDSKYHVYVYENSKWTLERNAIIPGHNSIVFSQIRELDDRLYIMINDYPGISYLLTGIRKK